MKYKILLLVAMVIVFGFSHEYQEKYVCHTVLEKEGLSTCFIVVIKAENEKIAEEKFRDFITRKVVKLSYKSEDISLHTVTKLKDAIMIEP